MVKMIHRLSSFWCCFLLWFYYYKFKMLYFNRTASRLITTVSIGRRRRLNVGGAVQWAAVIYTLLRPADPR